MNFRIKNVVVLGSGVMGSGIACHLANIGLKVMMLDILPQAQKHKNNIMRTLMIVKSVIASSLHLLGIEPLENM